MLFATKTGLGRKTGIWSKTMGVVLGIRSLTEVVAGPAQAQFAGRGAGADLAGAGGDRYSL